jgi:hypothetical protein
MNINPGLFEAQLKNAEESERLNNMASRPRPPRLPEEEIIQWQMRSVSLKRTDQVNHTISVTITGLKSTF